MPRRIESLFLAGPAGRLEALLEEPEDAAPVEAAVVCHPHPLHGGTLHNKVVYRIARGLRSSGCVVLRFNFRGVNLSEGEHAYGIGETDDAAVALTELHSRYPQMPKMIAGFSFGSRVALRLASQEPEIQRVVAVGFPTRIAEREFVRQISVPKFFIQSTHDEFAPEGDFKQFYADVPEPKQLDWVAAADHFFRDGLDDFEATVRRVGLAR